jgi:hypothetical protein
MGLSLQEKLHRRMAVEVAIKQKINNPSVPTNKRKLATE